MSSRIEDLLITLSTLATQALQAQMDLTMYLEHERIKNPMNFDRNIAPWAVPVWNSMARQNQFDLHTIEAIRTLAGK